jgi:hypothetical protein
MEHVGYLGLWENNYKIGPRGRRCEGVDWLQLAQEKTQWLGLEEHGMKFVIPCSSFRYYQYFIWGIWY